MCLPISARTAQSLVSNNDHLHYIKADTSPPFTAEHKHARITWARRLLPFGFDFWRQVVFSDEKKFSFDGPDCDRFYWHNKRGKLRVHVKRHSGGGKVLVWICMSALGLGCVAWAQKRVIGPYYVEILQSGLKEAVKYITDGPWVFQHDNTPSHTSVVALNWLKNNEIDVLQWPAYSPDLNPMEHVWAMFFKEVYKNGKQYNSASKLWEAIEAVAKQLTDDKFESLIESISDRLMDVIANGGGRTKY